jgi:hypothetical protein
LIAAAEDVVEGRELADSVDVAVDEAREKVGTDEAVATGEEASTENAPLTYI